jgi:hypothetical protein
VLLPAVDRVWGAWWSLETVGRAIAAVQYIPCLIYPEHENPVFAPWTRNGGGGPPCLWGFEGHLYTHRWLEPNVTFLKEALSVPGVTEALSRAVAKPSNYLVMFSAICAKTAWILAISMISPVATISTLRHEYPTLSAIF